MREILFLQLLHIVHYLLINSQTTIVMGNQAQQQHQQQYQHQNTSGGNSGKNASEMGTLNMAMTETGLHDITHNTIVASIDGEPSNHLDLSGTNVGIASAENDDDDDQENVNIQSNIPNKVDGNVLVAVGTDDDGEGDSDDNEEGDMMDDTGDENNKDITVTMIVPTEKMETPTATTQLEARFSSTMPTPWLPVITLASSSITLGNQTYYKPAHKSSKQPQNAPRKHLPKIQRTDAPMLNYIFDSISSANKHHHHDHRYGPHFEDISSTGNVTNITVQVGNSVYLNCRISLLQDKTVSWVRRKSSESGSESNLDLLTVGMHTYSGDNRYKIEFQYPNNWRLKIESAIKEDEGTYECQISTYPPRVIQRNLFIIDPKVLIIDEEGIALQDKYYEVDSTMQLSCIVRQVSMSSAVVYWSHGDKILNHDVSRGGVSVKTEILEKGANSTLYIAKINKSDSGNYTCSINSSHDFTVLVHVLNGESFAELHHGNSTKVIALGTKLCLLLVIVNLILLNLRKR